MECMLPLRILETCPEPPMDIEWQRWPSAATNVRFTGNRIALEQITSISQAEAAGHRLVVRYSGTEPKLRIHVEGVNAEHWSKQIADESRQHLSGRTMNSIRRLGVNIDHVATLRQARRSQYPDPVAAAAAAELAGADQITCHLKD